MKRILPFPDKTVKVKGPFPQGEAATLPKGDAKGRAHTWLSYARNVAPQAEDQRNIFFSGGWGRGWLAGGALRVNKRSGVAQISPSFQCGWSRVGDLEAEWEVTLEGWVCFKCVDLG